MSQIHLSRIVIGDDGKPLARPPAIGQAKRDRREEALHKLGTAWLRLAPAEEYPSSRKEYEERAAKRRAITLAAYGVGDGKQYKNAPLEYGGASRSEKYAPPVADNSATLAMLSMFDDEASDQLGPAELAELREAGCDGVGGFGRGWSGIGLRHEICGSR